MHRIAPGLVALALAAGPVGALTVTTIRETTLHDVAIRLLTPGDARPATPAPPSRRDP